MKIEVRPQPLTIDHRAIVPMEGNIFHEEQILGYDRTWEEYVPTGYDGKTAVPLLVDVHGGSSHNATYCRPWSHIAERETFIVLYPHSIVNGVTWNVFRDLGPEHGMPDDVAYIDYLIEKMFSTYNIDRTRVYIHGQSMGDMMTTTYLRERSYLFAAAAPFSGPSGPMHHMHDDGSLILPAAKCPVTRTHGSLDMSVPLGLQKPPKPEAFINPKKRFTREDQRFEGGMPRPGQTVTEEQRQQKMELHQLTNLRPWWEKNEVDLTKPEISLRGKYACVNFHGEGAYDVNFLTVEGGEHNPAHEVYDFLWRYFFSAYRRVDGEVIRRTPDVRFVPDQGAVIAAAGSESAFVNNVKVPLGGKAFEQDGAMYVPAAFLPKAFPGQLSFEVIYEGEDGQCGLIGSPKGQLQIASGSKSTLLDGYFHSMNRVLLCDGELYVSLGEVAELLLDKKVSQGRDIIYVADTCGPIGYDFAYLIRWLLDVQQVPTNAELLAREKEIVAGGNYRAAADFPEKKE